MIDWVLVIRCRECNFFFQDIPVTLETCLFAFAFLAEEQTDSDCVLHFVTPLFFNVHVFYILLFLYFSMYTFSCVCFSPLLKNNLPKICKDTIRVRHNFDVHVNAYVRYIKNFYLYTQERPPTCDEILFNYFCFERRSSGMPFAGKRMKGMRIKLKKREREKYYLRYLLY